MEAKQNPGTIGVDDDSVEPEKCPEKPAAGNRVFKAQFGRHRTSDEQFLIRPCGVIYARATMYGTEAVSNVLVWPVTRMLYPSYVLFIDTCYSASPKTHSRFLVQESQHTYSTTPTV